MNRHCRLVVRLPIILASFLTAAGAEEEAATFMQDFEMSEAGDLPEGMMEIEGTFKVDVIDGRKALRLAEDPLAEDAVILGPSFKGEGSAQVSVKADKKRRSFPRFGIGLHGISGYRLRVVGASGTVELVKNEEVVKSVPYEWDSAVWNTLRLEVREKEGKWIIEGRVWPEDGEVPAEATVSLESDQAPGQGKASLWGTPYAGLPIWYDSVVISSSPVAEAKRE